MRQEGNRDLGGAVLPRRVSCDLGAGPSCQPDPVPAVGAPRQGVDRLLRLLPAVPALQGHHAQEAAARLEETIPG